MSGDGVQAVPGSGDGEWCGGGWGDDAGWDGVLDSDPGFAPDPGRSDAEWAAMLARDAEQMAFEPSDVPDDGPPELTAEEFSREILTGGADAAALLMETLEPGPRMAELLSVLTPASLSPASMVSVVAATEKLASWVQARQHRWLAVFACPGVAAPVSDLRDYASQPGQPLHQNSPKSAGSRVRPGSGVDADSDLTFSGSGVHGDPAVDTILNETAMKVAAAEVGAALHFSPMAAQRRVCQAVAFTVDLPATLRALEAGVIDRGRSLTIAERTQNLPVELRRRVEQAVLPKAVGRTAGQVRGIVDRAVIAVDPAAAKKRHERAVSERNVTHRAAEDGMGVFRAELRADKAQLAYSVIDQLAYQLKGTVVCESDPRGIGALRADVFSDLIDQLATTGTVTIRSTLHRRASTYEAPAPPTDAGSTHPAEGGDARADSNPAIDASLTTGASPAPSEVDGDGDLEAAFEGRGGDGAHRNVGVALGSHQGRVTHLNVTIAASTLAGMDDRPGELDGHGPIPADLARAIAASAETITTIAIKNCGTGLDLGRTIYRPRLALRDHVTTRDQTCRFPGCRRPSRRCQIDHSEEFCPERSDGGSTCPCNLQCLCAFHHGLKTGGLWDTVHHDDATITWTSPTGRRYLTQPRQWPTDDDDRPIVQSGGGEVDNADHTTASTHPGEHGIPGSNIRANPREASDDDDPPPF